MSVIELARGAELSAVYMYNVLKGAEVPALSTLHAILNTLGIINNSEENKRTILSVYHEWLNKRVERERTAAKHSTPVTDTRDVMLFILQEEFILEEEGVPDLWTQTVTRCAVTREQPVPVIPVEAT